MDKTRPTDAASGSILIYADAATRLQVRLDGATVWLSQRQIADLYQTTAQNVTQHIAHVYEEGELDESSTCKDFLQVQSEATVAAESVLGEQTQWAMAAARATVRKPRKVHKQRLSYMDVRVPE